MENNQLHLPPKESLIYYCLLQQGQQTQAGLAKKLGINRTTLTPHIQSLLHKGFLSQTIVGKRINFLAENPKKILENIEKQKKEIESVLPGLLDVYNTTNQQPTFSKFDGAENMLRLLTEMANEANYIKTFFSPGKFFSVFSLKKKDVRSLIKTIEKRGIMNRGLCANNPSGRKWMRNNPKFHMDTRLMPHDLSYPIECIITNKKIIMLSYEHRFAITIDSPDIKNFLETLFDYFWKISAKKQQREQ